MLLNTKMIEATLKDRGISVRKLAEVVGTSQSGLSTALKVGSLRADVLAKISVFLQIPIQEFFEGDTPTPSNKGLYLEQRVDLLEQELFELKQTDIGKKN